MLESDTEENSSRAIIYVTLSAVSFEGWVYGCLVCFKK